MNEVILPKSNHNLLREPPILSEVQRENLIPNIRITINKRIKETSFRLIILILNRIVIRITILCVIALLGVLRVVNAKTDGPIKLEKIDTRSLIDP